MIKIYGTEVCSFCLRAKRLAESYEMKYQWIDVHEKEGGDELKALLTDYKTVPQIFWHGNHIGGYEEFASEIENTSGGFGDGRL